MLSDDPARESTAVRRIAHRGFAGVNPENTVAAFEAAAETASVVELDVRRCATGELVVLHDDRLDRTTDRSGRVADTDLETLRSCDVQGSGEGVPTLAAALDAVPADVGVNVELKARGLAGDVAPLATAAANDVVVSSFDAAELMELQSTDVPTAFLFAAAPSSALATALALDCDALHPHYRCCLHSDVVARAHDHDLTVNAWTLTDAETTDRVAATGVDGVITDFPDLP